MLDLHSHVLAGVDDGAATLSDSLEIARAAVADGITELTATPHVRADFPTSATTMHRLVDELRELLADEGVPLVLHPGGEIALEHLGSISADELSSFGLGGGRHLLIEFPYVGWPLDVHERLFQLQLAGFVPVIAHPERSAEVKAAPERLAPLVEAGSLVQVTAASLDGRLGRSAQRAALELVQRGLAHVIASDAHTAAIREAGMGAAAEAVGGGSLARWLTTDVPRAILTGGQVPPRPAAADKRPWWRR